jgi:hypothetical protein
MLTTAHLSSTETWPRGTSARSSATSRASTGPRKPPGTLSSVMLTLYSLVAIRSTPMPARVPPRTRQPRPGGGDA